VYQYAFTIPTKEGDAPTKGLATAVWESAEVKAAIGKPYSGLIFNGNIFHFPTNLIYLGRAIAWGTELIRNIPTIEVARGRTSLRVNFTYATEFNLSDLTAYIKKQIPNSPEIFQCMTFLNQVIADSLTKSSRYMAVGRKYFPTVEDDREVARIDDMSLLEFRRGFYQAVHWGGNNGLTINVNVTTGIFWNSQMHTIIELALRTLGRPASEGMSLSNLTEMAFRQVSRNLRGLKFFIKYRGPQKERQIHMATSLSKETARSKRFDVNGQMMSVADYFQKTYNVRLRYPDAPLVKKAENFFPMELCYIVPVRPPSSSNTLSIC
jgi:eukaryotic translation initiation factor 2C